MTAPTNSQTAPQPDADLCYITTTALGAAALKKFRAVEHSTKETQLLLTPIGHFHVPFVAHTLRMPYTDFKNATRHIYLDWFTIRFKP